MVGEESGLAGSIICWENAVAAAIVVIVFATLSAVILFAMRVMAMVEKIVLILMLQVGGGRMWC